MVGFVLLGIWGGASLTPVIVSALAERGFDRERPLGARAGPDNAAGMGPGASPGSGQGFSDRLAGGRAVLARADASAGRIVGQIAIPELGLEADIREGLSRATLLLAVGHIPGTGFPGEVGNVGLAGHRDTFFRGLKDAQEGQIVELRTSDGLFFYRITTTQIVSPDETSVLAASANPTLTLVTCYPFYWVGRAPRRFIVHATLITAPTEERTAPGSADLPETTEGPSAALPARAWSIPAGSFPQPRYPGI